MWVRERERKETNKRCELWSYLGLVIDYTINGPDYVGLFIDCTINGPVNHYILYLISALQIMLTILLFIFLFSQIVLYLK